MARFVLAKPKLCFLRSLRGPGSGRRNVSNMIALYRHEEDHLMRDSVEDDQKLNHSCWVPHPRSGIYYPRGSEWVMDDVPSGAASFDRTYWLRSDEGVEKPLPDYYLGHTVYTSNYDSFSSRGVDGSSL